MRSFDLMVYFFDWRAENRVKNKRGLIFAAIVALYLAKCFRQGAVVTALKKMQLTLKWFKIQQIRITIQSIKAV